MLTLVNRPWAVSGFIRLADRDESSFDKSRSAACALTFHNRLLLAMFATFAKTSTFFY